MRINCIGFRNLIFLLKRIKLLKIESQIENPGHMIITQGKLSFVEEGTAVIWKLSLASGNAGICLRKIDHSVSLGSSSAKEDLSSADDNEERTIPQANEKHLSGSNFLQLHSYSPWSAVCSFLHAPFHPKYTCAIPWISETPFQQT